MTADYTLIIGNKALSSWSMRPWLVMAQADIPFEEIVVRLDRPDTKPAILAHSPSGMVPCLKVGDQAIWDSLAIAEYLAEQHPEKNLWPEDPVARARARCITAEMHAGFSNLRSVWPMDLSVKDAGVICGPRVAKDLRRIAKLWEESRALFGADGPFLFGTFSIADAFFAPVVTRINTYGPVPWFPPEASAYLSTILELPTMQRWFDGAAQEAADGWYREE